MVHEISAFKDYSEIFLLSSMVTFCKCSTNDREEGVYLAGWQRWEIGYIWEINHRSKHIKNNGN